MNELFTSGRQSIGASASVLPMNIQTDFLQDWLVGSPCCPRGSQESSPAQFKSIDSSVLSLLYGPLSHPYMTTGKTIALTIWTSVSKAMSPLQYAVQLCHRFSSKEKVSFNFIASVTIYSYFVVQENKISHCFHFFPMYMKNFNTIIWCSNRLSLILTHLEMCERKVSSSKLRALPLNRIVAFINGLNTVISHRNFIPKASAFGSRIGLENLNAISNLTKKKYKNGSRCRGLLKIWLWRQFFE